jgi:hypothetical protein
MKFLAETEIYRIDSCSNLATAGAAGFATPPNATTGFGKEEAAAAFVAGRRRDNVSALQRFLYG